MPQRHAHTNDPKGRLVVFDVRARRHLKQRRPELLDHIDAILDAVSRPDVWLEDPTWGREQFYRQDLDPGRWLRVVVDFTQVPAFVVTAFVQENVSPD